MAWPFDIASFVFSGHPFVDDPKYPIDISGIGGKSPIEDWSPCHPAWWNEVANGQLHRGTDNGTG